MLSAAVFFANASELATLTNTFSVSGVATDPTTITLTVTDPTGVANVYTYAAAQITRTGTGVYTKDVTCSTAGTWQYEWVGTGTATDTIEGTWDVQPTQVGRLYATVEALKSRLQLTGTGNDYEVHRACFTISRSIEEVCGTRFWRTATGVVRTYRPIDWWTLDIDDLVTISALATDGDGDGVYETSWSASDYQLLAGEDQYNPDAWTEQRPYRQIHAIGTKTFPIPLVIVGRRNRAQVTGVWGWPSVPYGVTEAALVFAQDVFLLRQAKFGSIPSDEFGPVPLRRNGVAVDLLRPYIHPRMLAGFA